MNGDATRFFTSPLYELNNRVLIHPFSIEAVGLEVMDHFNVSFASAVWTANRLIFVPFSTTRRMKVDGVWWYNGAAVDGSTDVGVYSEDGQTKLGSSGATLNSGTNVLQDANATDFFLPAGRRFWLTLGCDSSVQTYFRQAPSAFLQEFIGLKEQLSGWSSGLPATITIGLPTVAVIPMFGIRGVATV